MKWFWKINYLLTIYLLLILLLMLPTGTNFYQNNKWFVLLEKILTINGLLQIISMVIEWVQFLLCLFVLIFKKDERKFWHFLFLISLIVLNLTKWILWILLSGEVTYKTN